MADLPVSYITGQAGHLADHDTIQVRVKRPTDFGAVGNGTADDTAALEAWLASAVAGDVLELGGEGLTYRLIRNLVPAVDDLTVHGSGAKLKADYDNSTGAMDTNGWVIRPTGRDGLVIDGIVFATPVGTFPSATEGASVHFNNCNYSVARNCTFEAGTGAPFNKCDTAGRGIGNRFEDNYIEDAGTLHYHYGGCRRTVAKGNTIIDAAGNGISGTANNGTIASQDNVCEDNWIVNAGRMGIEDGDFSGGTCTRSVIRGNRILTTGADAAYAAEGYGISAVGDDATVEENTVVNPRTVGIESSCTGNTVRGNRVAYTANRAIGIIANSGAGGVTIEGNTITGTGANNAGEAGIKLTGTCAGEAVVIRDNKIDEPYAHGINLDPTTVDNLLVEGNEVYCATTAALAGRSLLVANANCNGARIRGNTVRVNTGATDAVLIKPLAADLLFEGNVIDDSGLGGGVATGGGTPDRNQWIGNVFLGTATFDGTGMTKLTLVANQFAVAPTSVSTTDLTYVGNRVAGTAADTYLPAGLKFTATDGSGVIDLIEQTAMSAPAANSGRVYCDDSGGKTRLMVRFASGAAQQIAIEP